MSLSLAHAREEAIRPKNMIYIFIEICVKASKLCRYDG